MSSLAIDTWSTTPGSNNATPPNGAPEGQAPSTVNDCIRQIMAVETTYSRQLPTAGGSANAQTLTTAIPQTTLVRGMRHRFYPVAANTGDTTFAPDGLTAKHVYAYGAVLLGGELQTNVPADVVYDETLNSSAGGWVLMNPQDATGSFTITLTGTSGTTTGTVKWRIVRGKTVYIIVDAAINGTSNSTSMTGTGIPSALAPATSKFIQVMLQDNTISFQAGQIETGTSTTWTFHATLSTSTTNFTNVNTKGLRAQVISYTLD